MSYAKRRYRVRNGKLTMAYNNLDEDGWVKAKADAWSAWEASAAPSAPEPAPEPETPVPEPCAPCTPAEPPPDDNEDDLEIPDTLKRKPGRPRKDSTD